jgi:hypothetical protein
MNETYRWARNRINDAINGKKSSSSVFMRPPETGKTETALIIARDFHGAFIDRMSETEQKEFFTGIAKEKINTLIIDDPSNWLRESDFHAMLSVIKNLITGEVQMGRATVFDINFPFPLRMKIAFLIFCTPDQWTIIRKRVKLTGLYDRSSMFYCDHSPETKDYIKEQYEKHSYEKTNLPYFNCNGQEGFSQEFKISATRRRPFIEEIKFIEY